MDLSVISAAAESQLHTWFDQQLNNSMLIAGIGTVLLSGTMFALKSIPGKIWDAFYHRTTITVEVFSDNDIFYEVVKELNKNTVNWLSRSNVLDKESLTVGMGGSWSKFQGSYVKIDREKEKSDAKEFKQTLTLRFFFKTKKQVNTLFEKFFAERKIVKKDSIKVFNLTQGAWLSSVKRIPKRKRESVFLAEETLAYIEKRIKFFLDNRQWYEDRGVPYKYAILLHGVPGTGKSTLAKYIASFTDRDFITINPSKLPVLASAINNADYEDEEYGKEKVGQSYVGLLEDIDCDNITAKRSDAEPDDGDDSDNSKFQLVNLSDLLNAIDGINSPENFILVATTNHLNKLDPALFRKGRFDDVIEVLPLETPEILRMVKFFFGVTKIKGAALEYEPTPGAIVQDIILQHFDEGIDKVIETLNEKYARIRLS